MYHVKSSLEDSVAKVYIFVGEKENDSMKKSAKILHEKLRESSLQILPGMRHGDFSINYAKDYADKIRRIKLC